MRLTVVMPIYNAMPFLPEAVNSVLGQSFGDFELMAIDDGSSDGSYSYLQTLSDTRLTIMKMGTRQGQGAARNAALQQCGTEFVAFADADDISLPERFERQIQCFDQHKELGMLGTGIAYMGRTGRSGFSPPLASDHDAIRSDLLMGRHAVVNSTLMFRANVFERTGLFRISQAGEDWDLFLRMTEATKVRNLKEILCHIRVHSGSTNAQQAKTLRLRYAHACESARNRAASLPETTFEEFCQRDLRVSTLDRAFEGLDCVAAGQYRAGVCDVLIGKKAIGYSRLLLAALVSPQRLTQRIRRTIRGLQ